IRRTPPRWRRPSAGICSRATGGRRQTAGTFSPAITARSKNSARRWVFVTTTISRPASSPTPPVSRYYYGIDFSPRDLRLGLIEAADGRIGTPIDQLLLFCFHYDPVTGKYGL